MADEPKEIDRVLRWIVRIGIPGILAAYAGEWKNDNNQLADLAEIRTIAARAEVKAESVEDLTGNLSVEFAAIHRKLDLLLEKQP